MRDLRSYQKSTVFRLIIGGLLIVFIVGDGLIFLIYGPQAALSGLLCIGGGMLPIVLIVVFLWVIDRVVKNANKE
jgi:F0F1-type ATP synthase assembly protein I